MTEREKRMHRCCIVGEKTPTADKPELSVRCELRRAIEDAIQAGYTTFLTGLEPGPERWAAEILSKEKARFYPQLKLIALLPRESGEKPRSKQERERERELLQHMDLVCSVASREDPEHRTRQSRWMAEHARRMIAVYEESSSYTKTALRAAMEECLEIRFAGVEGALHRPG